MNIPLCIPEIDQDEIDSVLKVLKSGWLAHGEYNHKFEESFSEFIGVKHSISLNSCTSALELALKAHNIKGEVIVPSMTWNATANSVINTGGKPVFSEINPKTRNITAKLINEKITTKTEAVIIVHFGGQPCSMDEIIELCDKKNLLLIEDSAETLGGTWKGKKTGSFANGCFSFFPTKNITTGEGGMFTTNDDNIANRVRTLSAHGVSSSTFEREKKIKPWIRASIEAGHNFRLSNMLAAIGWVQMKKIDIFNEKRNIIAKKYSDFIDAYLKNKVEKPFLHENASHSFQMYTVTVDQENRDKIVNYLRDNGVGASVHFDPPVHLQPFYENLGYKSGTLPVTEKLSLELITLPMFPSMSQKQIEKVLTELKKAVELYI